MKPTKIKLFEEEEEKAKVKPEFLTEEEEQEEQEEQALEKFDDILLNTPTFGDKIYSKLPDIIKRMLIPMKSERQKDVFLTSMFASVGAYFSKNTDMWYHGSYVTPCTYMCVTAPSGYGKTPINRGADLVSQEDDIRNANYIAQMEEYKLREEDKEIEAGEEEPKHQQFILPTDLSVAKLLEYVEEASKRCQGVCIIDDEMDTLTQKFKSQHGDSSPVLRKFWDSSTVKKSTKGDKQQLIVKSPKVSICLGGTPDQPVKLFSNGDNDTNGLLQRFNIYIFSVNFTFKGAFDKGEEKKESHESYYNSFFPSIKEHGDYPVTFKISDAQEQVFNEFFQRFINEHNSSVKNITSFVVRMARAFLAITMTLSRLEKVHRAEIVRFNDDIFQLGLDIFAVYAEHTITAYKLLFKGGQKVNVKNIEKMSNEKFLEGFKKHIGGKEFSTKQFIEWAESKGQKVDVKERRRLTALISRSKYVMDVSHGIKKFI